MISGKYLKKQVVQIGTYKLISQFDLNLLNQKCCQIKSNEM